MISLRYDDIVVNNKLLINSGKLLLNNTGFVLVKGKNGIGKSLFFQNIIYENPNLDLILINQLNNQTFSKLTVLENITMNNNYNVIKEVEELGFKNLILKSVKSLSGGEQRIISILRCYFSEAKIILIDEPTNDLDFKTVEKIINLFKKMKKEKLVICISHDDRLDSIKDGIIEFKDKNIINNTKLNKENMYINKPKNKNYNIINKIFKLNFLPSIIVLLFLYILGICLIDYKRINEVETNELRKNQVELYKPVSNTLNGIFFSDVLLYDAIDLINEKNIYKKIKKSIKIKENLNSETEYELEKIKRNEFDFYPFEFYDPNEKKTIYVLDYYKEKNNMEFLDTTLLFDNPRNNEKGEKINKEIYDQCVAELIDKYELVCVIIIFNDVIDYKLLNELPIKKDNTYIRTNDTIKCVNDLKILNNIVEHIYIILVTFILIVLLESLLLYLKLKNIKTEIMTLKNLNYEYNNMFNILNDSLNNRFLFIIGIFIFFIFNIIYINKGFNVINYVYSILLFLVVPISYHINKTIINKFLKLYYRWNYR